MAFNGLGTFVLDQNFPADRDAGIPSAYIQANLVDDEFKNVKGGLESCLTRSGETAPTANLPMNTFKHTGVANASARNHYGVVGQIQDGSYVLGTVGGTGDVVTLTLTPAVTAYAPGQKFRWIATAANTTAVTVNVNGIGAVNLRKGTGSSDLAANDITIGQVVEAVYDGTQFQMTSPVGGQIASYQPLDATLTALAALTIAADKLIYGTGADAFALTDLTSVARTLIGQTTQALMRTTGLGLSANGSSFVSAADYAAMAALLPVLLLAGGTLTGELIISNTAPTNAYSAGFRRLPAASITTGTVVAADSGRCVYATGTVTFPSGVFAQGDAISIFAGGSARTLQASGITMRLHGTATTGNRTLAAQGFATVLYISASECVVLGDVT